MSALKFPLKSNWQPPDAWTRIRTIDAHAAGEPLRIIMEGFPELPGSTILERRRLAGEKYDHLRRVLMWEPRGHADMYGCIVVPPVSAGADFGVLFTHNEGFSTMCGHGIIAVTRVVLETGLLPLTEPETRVQIDTPAGPVTAFGRVTNGRVGSVYFRNVPSFVLLQDERVDVPGLGAIPFDVAFGGAFYAFVKAADAGVEMTPAHNRELIEKGMAIKHAVMDRFAIVHPYEQDLNFLYGTIFYGPALNPGIDSRNVCIFAEGEVDRSPTGTGVSARMALHFQKGELAAGQVMSIESIIGTVFSGQVAEEVNFGPYQAVIPQVEGSAHITGRHEFLIDPQDEIRDGFIIR